MGKLRPCNKANATSQRIVLDRYLGLWFSGPEHGRHTQGRSEKLSPVPTFLPPPPGPTRHWALCHHRGPTSTSHVEDTAALHYSLALYLRPDSTSQNIVPSLSVQNRLEAAVLRKGLLGPWLASGGFHHLLVRTAQWAQTVCIHNSVYVEHLLSFREPGIF